MKQTFRLSGVRGPFQGLFTTMVRNVPANSVYLGSFEVLKNAAAEYKGVSVPELPAAYVLGSAGFGGILYWCAIYPVDVCKSAIMTVRRSPTLARFCNLILIMCMDQSCKSEEQCKSRAMLSVAKMCLQGRRM